MSTQFITVEGAHWYPSPTLPGVFYPSVTTVLSIFPKGKHFEKYLANHDSYESSQEVLKAAGERGTRVHKATELLEDGNTLSKENYTLEEWGMIQGFVNWWNEYKPKLIKSEYPISSDTYKTGCTIDRVYIINDRLLGEFRCIIDWKTSNAIHDNYWIQVAANKKLWEEKHPDQPIDYVGIVQLSNRTKKKYKYELKDASIESEEDFEMFKTTQALWHYINPKAKPKTIDVPDTLQLEVVTDEEWERITLEKRMAEADDVDRDLAEFKLDL